MLRKKYEREKYKRDPFNKKKKENSVWQQIEKKNELSNLTEYINIRSQVILQEIQFGLVISQNLQFFGFFVVRIF